MKLNIEYRVISQLQFKDCNEFKAEFLNAEVKEKVWRMKKGLMPIIRCLDQN